MIQFLPAIIMFTITIAFVTLFFVPVTVFKQKNELIRFYWIGVWGFIAMITAFSGATETLKMLHYETGNIPLAFLTALTSCFVIFVMFGWCRLSFGAIRAGVTHFLEKRRRA